MIFYQIYPLHTDNADNQNVGTLVYVMDIPRQWAHQFNVQEFTSPKVGRDSKGGSRVAFLERVMAGCEMLPCGPSQ